MKMIMPNAFADVQSISKLLSWQDFYKNNLSIENIWYDISWFPFIKYSFDCQSGRTINNKLKKIAESGKIIYPNPSILFYTFYITPSTDLRVVILGQDPYPKYDSIIVHNDNLSKELIDIPQAMGMSFSVPSGMVLPSSLINIYKNLVKYGHMKKIPHECNLWLWANQGCLFLNSSLTVEKNSKESHMSLWSPITDRLIESISTYTKDVVFILWGAHALEKKKLIDIDRHFIIASSHPSGLSANKGLKGYPAFFDQDHFGIANNYLIKSGKKSILWALP